MPRACVTCLRPELFLEFNGKRISNLRLGKQGHVCGFCELGPEITLQKRLELSLELAEAMKHIEEGTR